MATAAEIIERPELDIPPLTATTSKAKGYSHDELAHFRIGHDDIDKIILSIYKFGDKNKNKRLNIRPNVLDASFEDSIDQTPSFIITIHDPTWELLNTGALDKTIDVNPGRIPHRWYRLASVSVVDDDVTLVFDTRNAVYLSYHKRPQKANRKRMTRAQFIKRLLRDVKKTRIKFYSPQLTQHQDVAKKTPAERAEKRSKGFTASDKITAKGLPADSKQRDVIEAVIRAGDNVGAPKLVIIAGVMTVIHESVAGKITGGNPPFVGPFQQRHADGWPATGDAYRDAVGNGKKGVKQGGWYGWAIPIWNSNPNIDLGFFVATVQGVVGSTNPLNNGFAQQANRWRGEAQHAVNAYGGIEGSDGGPTQVSYRRKYEFEVKDDDNYLATIYRLAEEVNWRAFWVRDVLHFSSETDLFRAKARTRLRRGEDGVERISFEWDRGKKVNEMQLTVRMERWICPVGTVVIFDEGGPAQGRWLVSNIRRSMFDELGEVTLKKPMREKKEPAGDPATRNPTRADDPTSVLDGGDVAGTGGIEDVKTNWTPKQIIDNIVLGHARNHQMTYGINAQAVTEANHRHSLYVAGTNRISMHKGPPAIQWAVDMGVAGVSHPTPNKDDLASELIMAFNLPDLGSPNATSGYHEENWVNKNAKGFHFQLGYRSTDHYDHVHFGVARISHVPSHQQ